jgi:hypothetical protein
MNAKALSEVVSAIAVSKIYLAGEIKASAPGLSTSVRESVLRALKAWSHKVIVSKKWLGFLESAAGSIKFSDRSYKK